MPYDFCINRMVGWQLKEWAQMYPSWMVLTLPLEVAGLFNFTDGIFVSPINYVSKKPL